jgi:hypothetical protein
VTDLTAVSEHRDALAWADAQVAASRDDPAARLELMERLFHGPTGRAPRHLPFRRAALSFMRWQAQRGLLNQLDAAVPGSVWWRAMNERLLRDGCEAIALVGGLRGEPSSQAVRLWLQFADTPTPSCWYRAHNASIVAGYLEHEERAEEESVPERFFMNVALARVLYAHALVAAPRLALGRVAPVRGDRAEAAAPLRVVRGRARRTAPARARLRRKPNLRLAVRATTRVTYRALAVPRRRPRTPHAGPLKCS